MICKSPKCIANDWFRPALPPSRSYLCGSGFFNCTKFSKLLKKSLTNGGKIKKNTVVNTKCTTQFLRAFGIYLKTLYVTPGHLKVFYTYLPVVSGSPPFPCGVSCHSAIGNLQLCPKIFNKPFHTAITPIIHSHH